MARSWPSVVHVRTPFWHGQAVSTWSNIEQALNAPFIFFSTPYILKPHNKTTSFLFFPSSSACVCVRFPFYFLPCWNQDEIHLIFNTQNKTPVLFCSLLRKNIKTIRFLFFVYIYLRRTAVCRFIIFLLFVPPNKQKKKHFIVISLKRERGGDVRGDVTGGLLLLLWGFLSSLFPLAAFVFGGGGWWTPNCTVCQVHK